MSAEKTYTSVSEMTKDLSDDAFTDELNRVISEYTIAKTLVALRSERGLTQTEMGAKLGKTQGAVSKLEHSKDSDLRLGDVEAYVGSLGFDVKIVIQPSCWTAVDSVKHHAFCMKRDLDYLVKLSKGDESLEDGVRNFWAEAFVNVVTILAKCGLPLAGLKKQSQPHIAVEVQRPDSARDSGSCLKLEAAAP